MGCHSLLQGIFLTQGSNLGLLFWQADFFYYLSHQGSPLTILKFLTNIFQVLGCQGKFYVFSISCCPNCHGGCHYAQKGRISTLHGFPGSTNGKESACNVRDAGSISGSGRCPGEGNGLISVILPGEFHGRSRLVSYNPWGCKESDRTEWLTHFQRGAQER